MFFKIEMTFILKSMGLHGNKKFEIEGNFISFKREKNFSSPSSSFSDTGL